MNEQAFNDNYFKDACWNMDDPFLQLEEAHSTLFPGQFSSFDPSKGPAPEVGPSCQTQDGVSEEARN